MRLKVPTASANEQLVALVNREYSVIETVRQDYTALKRSNTYAEDTDKARYEGLVNDWAGTVVQVLDREFPTELERNVLRKPPEK